MAIHGIDGMSWEELGDELARGGRFVSFPYCISVIILTFRRSSDVYFIRSGQRAASVGMRYVLMSLALGWWGVPWGPIYTLSAIFTAISGGRDCTSEVIADLPRLAEYSHNRRFECRATASLSDGELASAAGWLETLAVEVRVVSERLAALWASHSLADHEAALHAAKRSRLRVTDSEPPPGTRESVQAYVSGLDSLIAYLQTNPVHDAMATIEGRGVWSVGVASLEAQYEEIREAIDARQRDGGDPHYHLSTTEQGAPAWVRVSTPVVIVALALAAGTYLLPSQALPTPKLTVPAAEGTTGTNTVPDNADTPYMPKAAEHARTLAGWSTLCDESLGGCIEAPISWNCRTDQGQLGCKLTNGGAVSLRIQELRAAPRPGELESWLEGKIIEQPSLWQDVGKATAETEYSGGRICYRASIVAEAAKPLGRAQMSYYECRLPTWNTLMVFAVRFDGQQDPSDESLSILIGSFSPGSTTTGTAEPNPASD